MPSPDIPFVAAHPSTVITADRGPADIAWIIIHTMEAPEKGSTAEQIAQFFASKTKGSGGTRPIASAHYCIDNDSIVQCVQCKDIAAGARGGNKKGIHLEHAGYARQTAAHWEDEYSVAMLALSAELCREILVPKFHIPVRWLMPEDLKVGSRGFTSHANISEAFSPGGHWDPGPHFPARRYLQMVAGK